MPRSAMRICAQPGCGSAAAGIYCAGHGGAMARARDPRTSSSSRGYDGRHRNWRKLVLHRDPLCKIAHFCKGMMPSTVADHIIPLRAGGDWSLENGQGSCKPCHDWKTREVDMPKIREYQKRNLTPVLPSEHALGAGESKGKAETASRDKTVSGAADSGESRVGGTSRSFAARARS